MAIQEFWDNVRIAAGLIEPRVRADPPLEAQEYERILRASDLWLTPRAVEGFDVKEFDFLSKGEKAQLESYVKEFREIAERIPGDVPAGKEDAEKALGALRGILDILRPDQNPDLDAFRATKALQNFPLPRGVVELRHEFDLDSTGDPGIWVWIIVEDDVFDAPGFFEKSKRIRADIEWALRRVQGRYWPYLHVRTVSDQRSLAGSRRR